MTTERERIAKRIETLIPKYGEICSRIPGSIFVRWYCVLCGEPMRVSNDHWPPVHTTCERCAGRHGQVGRGHGGPIDDVTGYQANAIRAMEGD